MLRIILFREVDAIEKRLNIEAGTADEDRDMAAPVDAVDRFRRHLLEGLHVIIGVDVDDVDEVVRNTLHLLLRHLRRADVEAAVDLDGIR